MSLHIDPMSTMNHLSCHIDSFMLLFMSIPESVDNSTINATVAPSMMKKSNLYSIEK